MILKPNQRSQIMPLPVVLLSTISQEEQPPDGGVCDQCAKSRDGGYSHDLC